MNKRAVQISILALLLAAAVFVWVMGAGRLKYKALRPNPPAGITRTEKVPLPSRLKSEYADWQRDPFTFGEAGAELVAQIKLSGIYCDGKTPYCIIDDNVLKVGDEIYGFIVSEISKDGVLLKRGGEGKKLTIAE